MAVGIENVFENDTIRSLRPVGGHVALEINAHCPFEAESACGGRCVLQMRKAPKQQLLSEAEIFDAFTELLDCGQSLRHFGIPGMEPLASPKILFGLLERYHARSPATRPLTFNIITSGTRLDHFAARFRELPLDALVISVDDTPSTGLRVASAAEAAVRGAIRVREVGGCRYLCINTVLTRTNADAVLAIARRLRDVGVDQMLVAPLLVPSGATLEPAVPEAEVLDFAHRAADSGLDGVPILVAVEHETLRTAAGDDRAFREQRQQWSLRLPLAGSAVSLLAWNPEARYLRIRWDGQLLARHEFMRIGLPRAAAGRYDRGRIRELIRAWPKPTYEEARVA